MKKTNLTTTQIIAGGFALAILAGALLLTLPFAAADGKGTGFLDALFTATTSICVTGLTTVTTAAHWSLFGQIVILLLIQLGGLGVITVMMLVFLSVGKRMTIKERMVVQDTYNLSGLGGISSLLRKIALGTFLVEGIGAACYAFVFVPEMGAVEGLWQSLFLAVSAFCNAGIDILGEASLAPYAANAWINGITMCLIVLGGLGFLVWWDLISGLRREREKREHLFFRRLTLHTKIVLAVTAGLLVIGTLLIFLFEYKNPETLGNLPLGQKWMAALFQSVTFRTAGFFTVPQGGLTGGSLLVAYIWMFIGGSPAGTAGGVKTTTFILLILSVWSVIRGRENVHAFGRKIPEANVRTALAVLTIGILAVLGGTMILSLTESFALEDLLFEAVSAMGTVGLTRGITSALSGVGKCVIIALMFMGRIGPVTLAMAFAARRRKYMANIQLPEERILIG
jgi:trk system potassium uptake protein TrkH